MKTRKIISYGLLAGLMLGSAAPAMHAGERKGTLKSRVKKVVSSKWFKVGVGAAALCAAGAGLFFYGQNLKSFCLGAGWSEGGVSSLLPITFEDLRKECQLGNPIRGDIVKVAENRTLDSFGPSYYGDHEAQVIWHFGRPDAIRIALRYATLDEAKEALGPIAQAGLKRGGWVDSCACSLDNY